METFLTNNSLWIFIIVIFWVLPWKGYAMWTASQKGHRKWFIVFLILNTLAILEIFYVFQIAKKQSKDILNVFKSKV